MEAWMPVKGYEGIYSVSDLGNVRSEERVVPHPVGRGTKLVRSRILSADLTQYGYRQVCFSVLGRHRKYLVHRLVLTAFAGDCPEGQEGCHNDGNRSNNALSNLRWDYRAANHADKKAHGTNKPGEKCHLAKLTEKQVIEIISDPRTQREIATEYGIARSHVSRLKNGVRWTHLKI